jgi:hypothetical protein
VNFFPAEGGVERMLSYRSVKLFVTAIRRYFLEAQGEQAALRFSGNVQMGMDICLTAYSMNSFENDLVILKVAHHHTEQLCRGQS